MKKHIVQQQSLQYFYIDHQITLLLNNFPFLFPQKFLLISLISPLFDS